MEYYVSLLVFVILAIYILFQIQVLTPQHLREIKTHTIKLDAFQVSELLINDGGEPNNWNIQPPADIKRIGLSSMTSANLLSAAKVTALDTQCKSSGFVSLYNWLGMQNQFNLTISDTAGTLVDTQKYCPPLSKPNAPNTVVVTRVVTLDSGRQGNLTLTMW